MDTKTQWDSELLEMVKKSHPNELAFRVCGVRKSMSQNSVFDASMAKWLEKNKK
jgi:hypothetical protein